MHSRLHRQVQRAGRVQRHVLCHLPIGTNLRRGNGQCVRMRPRLHQQVWWCKRRMQWHVQWPVLREYYMPKWCVPIMWQPDRLRGCVRKYQLGSQPLWELHWRLWIRSPLLREFGMRAV